MESPVFGELLILFMMLFCCSRMFFLKYGKVDFLTILAPLSVILSVLQIVAWGADIISLSIFCVSIFCFLTNFRALLRFSGNLYVDHYNFGFKAGAFLVIISCVFGIRLILVSMPELFKDKDFEIEKQKVLLTGDFIGGFEEAKLFDEKNAEIVIFKPLAEEKNNSKAVIVVPDKRADSLEYYPLMKYLAGNGYTVFAGDFYTRDLKWFRNAGDTKLFRKCLMKRNYRLNKVKFESQKEFYGYNTRRELEAMLDFVKKDFDSVFVIGDWMSEISIPDFVSENADALSGYLILSSIEGYETPGLGFIQQTNPAYARFCGYKKAVPYNLYDYILNEIETQEAEDDAE